MSDKIGQRHLSDARRREFTGRPLTMADLDPAKEVDPGAEPSRKDIDHLHKRINSLSSQIQTLMAVIPSRTETSLMAIGKLKSVQRSACRRQIETLCAAFSAIYSDDRLTVLAMQSARRSDWLSKGRAIFNHLLGRHYPHIPTTEVAIYLAKDPSAISASSRRGERIAQAESTMFAQIEASWLSRIQIEPTAEPQKA